LPAAWQTKVYVPLWDNVFALFYNLAENASIEPLKKDQFAPPQLFLHSRAEKAFALKYSEGAKHRIKKFPYAEIKATGGADWVYRKLLEERLGIFEHFRGNGRTQNEVQDPQGEDSGLVEFVGPNRKLQDLPEVAIVHSGKLAINHTYAN
jgi:hypothetical protein